MTRFFAAAFVLLFGTSLSFAQQPVWIQIEAQPSLQAAQDRVTDYNSALDDVAGYYVGRNWYAIVLGPYDRDDATSLLRRLRSSGQIPSDSFIATGSSFRQQFWPVGESAPSAAQTVPEATERPADPVVAAPLELPDETVQQARDSEALLDREQKKDLQVALQWAGFYSGTIDGLYGRGTRSSMSAWQEANNIEPTGVLTTKQRKAVIDNYNSVLDGMDLQTVRDDATGIQIKVPTGVVAFAEYEPPFARFDATSDLGVQVLLISQAGTQNRLFGLYEILQTLEIIPTEGPRQRGNQSFTIEGIDDQRHTFITASLSDGEIKGFGLIWPAGDDERRRRVLDEMQGSFQSVSGVLDPTLSKPSEDQAIDLVSGLAVRRPAFSQSGFFIDASGSVLTTHDIVGACDRLTIDRNQDAEVTFADSDLGLAVLTPKSLLAPLGVASFQTGVPRIQSDIAVAGYSFGGVLSAASVTFGTLADIRGLNGEEDIKRLELAPQDGDVGGPVYDNAGAVLGMLLSSASQNGQVLPDNVRFSLDSDAIISALSNTGIELQTTSSVEFMPPAILRRQANDQTVLVECW